ncbi:hypothetical protein [Paenibacillus spongiae]|uniref:Uncharacterized protein n=1 Tax=Paenibacillus spongiae TaxID=2909671 RepID=A0ABY5SFA5_9BACL|nr:hypothetical protein [Paenibacillus spongiae]UVI31185.1 hypothetical protein L1F29_04905 [Paenibacillus spongiae]
MTLEIVKRWAEERNLTYAEALKEIEQLMNYAPRHEKGPFAEGPVQNNTYDPF